MVVNRFMSIKQVERQIPKKIFDFYNNGIFRSLWVGDATANILFLFNTRLEFESYFH